MRVTRVGHSTAGAGRAACGCTHAEEFFEKARRVLAIVEAELPVCCRERSLPHGVRGKR